MGQWQFGCDLCQSVCPWNGKAPTTREPAFVPAGPYPGADAVAGMSDEEFRRRFAGTPLERPKAAGMRRNAAIAIENARRANSGRGGPPYGRGRGPAGAGSEFTGGAR